MVTSSSGTGTFIPWGIGFMTGRNLKILNKVIGLAIDGFLVCHAEAAFGNLIFHLPPLHWNTEWQTLPFPIPPIA